MNNMRAITTRALVALSVALCAIVVVPDLTFAASNCNLKRDLVKANLEGCDLGDAYLSRVDLTGAHLFNANLTGANLRYAEMEGANFTDSRLTGANLTNANLTNADLTGADFTDSNLTDAVRRPGINRADMEGALGLDTAKGLLD